MPMNFLAPATKIAALETAGESAMKASLASGKAHGYEVGYSLFSINGHMLGHGEPIGVKSGERVLLHVVNGSATEIRSLALPGHTFRVVALDGNPVPTPSTVPVLWIGTGERVSAIVDMRHPGVWILGDTADDDRKHGMGIAVEYAGYKGKPIWVAPKPFRWDYTRFGTKGAPATPDDTLDLTFAKANAAADGFNLWTINGKSFSMVDQGAIGTAAARPPLSPADAQRERRHPPNPSAPTHVRADEGRRQADFRCQKRRCDGRRVSGTRDRRRRRQSWPDPFPLSPAVAHGLRLHGAVRLCVIVAQHQAAESDRIAARGSPDDCDLSAFGAVIVARP